MNNYLIFYINLNLNFEFISILYFLNKFLLNLFKIIEWGLGIGDWGLGIGDW